MGEGGPGLLTPVASHHHRLILIPQPLAAAPIFLGESLEPLRTALRQIIPHLDRRLARSDGLHQSPNLGSRSVACERLNAVAGIGSVGPQIENHPPIRCARLLCQGDPPSPAADLEKLYCV